MPSPEILRNDLEIMRGTDQRVVSNMSPQKAGKPACVLNDALYAGRERERS